MAEFQPYPENKEEEADPKNAPEFPPPKATTMLETWLTFGWRIQNIGGDMVLLEWPRG